MHQRQLIREAILGRVFLNIPEVGARVIVNQSSPHWGDEGYMPAINISVESETAEEYERSSLSFKRNLEVTFEIVAGDTSVEELANTLDDIAEQIERLVFVDETLGGTCERILLGNTSMDFSGDGAKKLGSTKISLICIYKTELPTRADQEAYLSGAFANETDLSGSNTEWDIGHNDGSPDEIIDAKDQLNI